MIRKSRRDILFDDNFVISIGYNNGHVPGIMIGISSRSNYENCAND